MIIAGGLQRLVQLTDEAFQLLLAGAGLGRFTRGGHHQGRVLRPFIGDEDHRLCEVQRSEFGIDRHGDDLLGDRYLLGFESGRSEEHTSELQSLMRISYAVFCLKKKNKKNEPRRY